MGTTRIPKYRLVLYESSVEHGSSTMSWNKRKPTVKQLGNHIRHLIDSYKTGGCNEHISNALGYMPIPNKARIVEQATNRVVVEWVAPMFMVI